MKRFLNMVSAKIRLGEKVSSVVVEG